jgi:hypothetical protein
MRGDPVTHHPRLGVVLLFGCLLLCPPVEAAEKAFRLGPRDGTSHRLDTPLVNDPSTGLTFRGIDRIRPVLVKLQAGGSTTLSLHWYPESTTLIVRCKVDVDPSSSQFTITESVDSTLTESGVQTASVVNGEVSFATTTGAAERYWYKLETTVPWTLHWCEITEL